MVIFVTYEEICEYIYNIPKYTKKNSLEHTRTLLRRLGNPEQQFEVIHVAGSNGKGSVCAFINSVLMEAGKHVGLFTSPHLICMEERFIINGDNCSQEVFRWSFEQVQAVIMDMQEEGLPHPAFFETLFAMGMLVFAKAGVEIVVLETGLGGRLDATNVVANPLMTIITSISLEHTEILGDTIEAIAAEKAGIIKEGTPVVFDASNEQAAAVIRSVAKSKQAPYYEINKKDLKIHELTGKNIDFCYANRYDKESPRLTIPFVAEYQMINAMLSYQALAMLQDELAIDIGCIKRGIAATVWHGRMQEIADGIYFDGAHNVNGMEAFVKTVASIGGEHPILLFSMVREKDYQQVIQILAQQIAWGMVVLTKIKDERGLEPELLAAEFEQWGIKTKIVEGSDAAYHYAVGQKNDNQTLFCAGSLYLIGELEIAAGEERGLK